MSKALDVMKERVREAADGVKRLERELASVEGQIKQAEKELKDSFEIESIKEARALLVEMDDDLAQLTKRGDRLEAQLEALLNEHGEQSKG